MIHGRIDDDDDDDVFVGTKLLVLLRCGLLGLTTFCFCWTLTLTLTHYCRNLQEYYYRPRHWIQMTIDETTLLFFDLESVSITSFVWWRRYEWKQMS